MSQTLLQIANSALIKVGAPVITSLTQLVKPAELCQARIRPIRDMILRSHVWTFARATASPTFAASDLAQWDGKFQLPTLCLRILRLSISDDTEEITRFEIIGRYVYTGTDSLFLRYILQPATADEATQTYPDDFAEVVSSYLAAEISTSLFDSPDRRNQWLQQYEGLLRQARFNGAVEQSLRSVQASAWLDSRNQTGGSDRSQYDLDAPAGGV